MKPTYGVNGGCKEFPLWLGVMGRGGVRDSPRGGHLHASFAFSITFAFPPQ